MLCDDCDFATVNGVRLAYQDLGDRDGPVILLIMGLGAQLIHWPDELVAPLLRQGFRVIRFDNRDAGLSQKLDDQPTFGWMTQLRFAMGLSLNPPYRLDAMAADAAELLSTLGVERAHVVGASMGGMIAQLVATNFPDKALTLTSIMSSTGALHLPRPSAELARLMLKRPAASQPDKALAHLRELLGAISSPRHRRSDSELDTLARTTFERCHYPDGVNRQLWATIGSGERLTRLRALQLPALVIHGTDDPLVSPEAGRHTAETVPGARLELIDGMSHSMEPVFAERIAGLIIEHAGRHGILR